MREPHVPNIGRLAIVPVLVYGILNAVHGTSAASPTALLGLALAAVPLVAVLVGRGWSLLLLVPVGGLAAGFVASLPSDFATDALGMALLGGLLIGVPLVVAAFVLLLERGSITLFPLTLAGLVELLTVFAAVGRLGPATGGSGPGSLVLAFVQVGQAQFAGLSALAGGAASVTLPLQDLFDPVFALLTLVAMIVPLLEFVSPQTPVPGVDAPSGPTTVLGPIAIAVISAASFELLAAATPRFALLALAVVVAAIVALFLVLARYPFSTWRARISSIAG